MRGRSAIAPALAALALAPAGAAARPAQAELRIAISASSGRIAPGETVRIRVAVEAPGAKSIELSEGFRGPIARVSYRGARYERSSGVLALGRGRAVLTVLVQARRAGTIRYSVRARGARPAELAITVRPAPPVSGSTGTVTTVTTPTTVPTTTAPGTAADFAIVAMTPAQAGQTVTIAVQNNGPSAASFVARFTFANATGSAGSTDSGRYADGVWTSGAVEPGRFVSVTIFTAKTASPATITGTVIGVLPDPDGSNDTRSQSF